MVRQRRRCILWFDLPFQIANQHVSMHSSPHHKNQGDYDRETERDERDFLTELDLKEFVDPVDGVREGGNEEQ